MHGPSTATAASARQAADDDAEERDDGVDDGLETGGDGIDNGHDAVADCAENGLDLWGFVSACMEMKVLLGYKTYAGYYGTHGCGWGGWLLQVEGFLLRG